MKSSPSLTSPFSGQPEALSPRAPRMEIRIVSWAEAQAFAPQWNSFAPSAFTTFEWQASWYEAYGGSEPIVIACLDGAELLGLAALQRQGRRIRILGDGTYDSDNLDFIYKEAWIVPELVNAARKLLGPLDVLDLRTLPSSSPLCSAFNTGWLTYRYETPHPVVTLPASREDYLKALSKKMRKSISQTLRRTEGRREAFVCRSEDQLSKLLGSLQALHAARWRSKGDEGAFALKGRTAFIELVARRFFRQGWLNFWVLELDGQEAATEFGFTFRGVYSHLMSGFDPTFAADSPGVVLRALLLESLINEGVRCYDFLGGEEEYKYRWGAQDARFVNLNATRLVSLASFWLAAKKLYRGAFRP